MYSCGQYGKMYVMIDQNRALALLGSGIGPTEVALTLGCDPSFVSQLLMDESFKQQVLAKRIEHLQEATTRDQNINHIEDDLIQKLKDCIPFMVKTQDILRAFAIINNAKRRGATVGTQVNLQQTVVQLNLPPAARRIFTTNANGEVVQVDNQSTITMPLQNLLADRARRAKEAANGQIEDAVITSSGAKGAR